MYKETLKQLVETTPIASISSKIKLSQKYKDLYNWITKQTSFLPQDAKLTERIYCILHDITQPVTCKICNKPLKFKSFSEGYGKYCSTKCACKDPEYIKKRQETNLKKYGSRSFLGTEQCLIKTKQTLKQKYGVDNIQKVPEIRKKTQQTNLKKYGSKSPLKNKTIFQKAIDNAKQSIKVKYGIDNIAKLPEVKQKISDKHRSDETKAKMKQSIKQRYGVEVDNISQVPEIAEEISNTLKSKYKHWKKGKQHHSVLDYIRYLRPDLEIHINDKTAIYPFVFDIYLPELKLGIFYETVKSYDTGLKQILEGRYRSVSKHNVQSLHIYNLEWHDEIKGKIWKSIIKYKLCLATRIHTRECKVVELDSDTTTNFLIYNHLQGPVIGASVRLGLMWEDELVAVMTFGKSRYTEHEWELYRFANKINLSVVGGMSKLFTYFIDHYKPTSVISYANKRWSKGDVYKKLGFKIAYETDLGYFYLDPNMRIVSRQSVQKYMLSKKLEHFDPNKTELENLLDHGYRIVFTPGNYACVWKDSYYCK